MENQKPLEEKTIIERHTIEGKFSLTAALNELDTRYKTLESKQKQMDEALSFIANWWDEKFGSGLIKLGNETSKIDLIK
jgi:hypothetical protein